MAKASKSGFYAVKRGHQPGVYTTWDECELQVKGYPNSSYKKFASRHEANSYVLGGAQNTQQSRPQTVQSSSSVAPQPQLPPLPPNGGYYAVRKGRIPGVYTSWEECEAQIRGFPKAEYTKVKSLREAEIFIGAASSSSASSSAVSQSNNSRLPPSIPVKERSVAPPKGMSSQEDALIVYTDGASSANGTKNAVAGVGVWWAHNDPRNISERCPGDQTNNRAELIAIARALETAPKNRRLVIKSDSSYSISCLEKWHKKWSMNGWKGSKGEAVKNSALIQYILALLHDRARRGVRATLMHVSAHVGIEGNEAADALARGGKAYALPDEPDWMMLKHKLESELETISSTAKEEVVFEIDEANRPSKAESASFEAELGLAQADLEEILDEDWLSPEELAELARTQDF